MVAHMNIKDTLHKNCVECNSLSINELNSIISMTCNVKDIRPCFYVWHYIYIYSECDT